MKSPTDAGEAKRSQRDPSATVARFHATTARLDPVIVPRKAGIRNEANESPRGESRGIAELEYPIHPVLAARANAYANLTPLGGEDVLAMALRGPHPFSDNLLG